MIMTDCIRRDIPSTRHEKWYMYSFLRMPLKHGMPKYNKKDLHSDAFQTFRSDIDLGYP